jgi:hypothetical protein
MPEIEFCEASLACGTSGKEKNMKLVHLLKIAGLSVVGMFVPIG